MAPAHRRADEQGADDPVTRARSTALRQGLQQLGWIEGRNMRPDIRPGAADPSIAQNGGRTRRAVARGHYPPRSDEMFPMPIVNGARHA